MSLEQLKPDNRNQELANYYSSLYAAQKSAFLQSGSLTEIPSVMRSNKKLRKMFGDDVTKQFFLFTSEVVRQASQGNRIGGKIINIADFEQTLNDIWEGEATTRNNKVGIELGSSIDEVFRYWRVHRTELERGGAKRVKDKISGRISDLIFKGASKVMDGAQKIDERIKDEHSDTERKIKNAISRKFKKRVKTAAKFLSEAPILLKMQEDILLGIDRLGESRSLSEDEVKDIMNEVSNFYHESLYKRPALTHPESISRIKKSLALNTIVYNRARDILGWSAYVVLLGTPQFREIVDNHGLAASMAAAGLLVGSMVGRVLLDGKVLNEVGWSPDALETIGSLSTAKIDPESQEIIMNTKVWPKIGVAYDVLRSMAPPYTLAMVANPPYSVVSYIGAVTVDQLTFMSINAGFLAYQKHKGKEK